MQLTEFMLIHTRYDCHNVFVAAVSIKCKFRVSLTFTAGGQMVFTGGQKFSMTRTFLWTVKPDGQNPPHSHIPALIEIHEIMTRLVTFGIK